MTRIGRRRSGLTGLWLTAVALAAGPGTRLGGVGWFGVSAFAGAYLLMWAAAGLAADGAIEAVRALNLGVLAWAAGGAIAGAGL